jgi:hypothetical protein
VKRLDGNRPAYRGHRRIRVIGNAFQGKICPLGAKLPRIVTETIAKKPANLPARDHETGSYLMLELAAIADFLAS